MARPINNIAAAYHTLSESAMSKERLTAFIKAFNQCKIINVQANDHQIAGEFKAMKDFRFNVSYYPDSSTLTVTSLISPDLMDMKDVDIEVEVKNIKSADDFIKAMAGPVADGINAHLGAAVEKYQEIVKQYQEELGALKNIKAWGGWLKGVK